MAYWIKNINFTCIRLFCTYSYVHTNVFRDFNFYSNEIMIKKNYWTSSIHMYFKCMGCRVLSILCILVLKMLYIKYLSLRETSSFFKAFLFVPMVTRQEKWKFIFFNWHLKFFFFQWGQTKRQTDDERNIFHVISSMRCKLYLCTCMIL